MKKKIKKTKENLTTLPEPNNNYDPVKDPIPEDYCIDENKFSRNSIKQETELFNDEDNIVYDVVSVKMISLPKGEDWEISKNNKLFLVLKGVRFSAPERKFLRTPEGMNFIIGGCKKGWKSVSEFARQIKCLK